MAFFYKSVRVNTAHVDTHDELIKNVQTSCLKQPWIKHFVMCFMINKKIKINKI